MDLYAMSDGAIGKELGRRFRDRRLRKNITQEELAERIMVSLNRIKALEAGKGKLETIIPVLRELDSLDDLNSFLPEPSISPLQLAQMRGKRRQRASGKPREEGEGSEW